VDVSVGDHGDWLQLEHGSGQGMARSTSRHCMFVASSSLHGRRGELCGRGRSQVMALGESG
jgi:hypothetical protein